MVRVNIYCEVSMISSFVAIPQEVNLQHLYHKFAYQKEHQNEMLVFDPNHNEFEYNKFYRKDCYKFYEYVEEDFPPYIP